MPSEKQWIKHLFKRLITQPRVQFPSNGESLTAPRLPGVYIIRRGRKVLHVGRTLRVTKGLWQRLTKHHSWEVKHSLAPFYVASSSFANAFNTTSDSAG
jgi:hypothetical protein